jgi:hypothetical protein
MLIVYILITDTLLNLTADVRVYFPPTGKNFSKVGKYIRPLSENVPKYCAG